MMRDVTAIYRGITTPMRDLLDQIYQAGWEPTVKWGSDYFVATGKNQYGEKIEKTGPDEKTAAANLLVAVMRRNHLRTTASWKIGVWEHDWTAHKEAIAQAYAKAPVYEPKAANYFHELGQDSVRRARVIANQLQIEYTDEPEPYHSIEDMLKDIYDKQKYIVSAYDPDHPIWTPDQVVAFRIVHDVMGHAVAGAGFDWPGENRACAAHAPLLSPGAQAALWVQCIAQNAYYDHYRGYAPQKIFVPPTDMFDAEDGPPLHGTHPSDTVVPTSVPSANPHTAATTADPNQGWSSGIDPLPNNAYLMHGDPLDGNAVMDNAALIDTKWHSLKTGNGQFDRERAKLAVVNAFRVVLLSPRKDLRWNAIHYQDISGIPGHVDDPKVYWDTLEAKRKAWNVAQGIDPQAHMIYFKFLKPFQSIIHQQRPNLSFEQAKEEADRTLYEWWSQEQQRIEEEDAQKPADKQRSADEIERRANEALAKRIQTYIKAQVNPDTDHQDDEPEQMGLFAKTANIAWTPGSYGKGAVDDHTGVVHTWNVTLGGMRARPHHDEYYDANGVTSPSIAFHIRPDGGTDLTDPEDEAYIKQHDPRLYAAEDWQPMEGPKVAAGGQYNILTGEEALKYGAFMGTHLKSISQISQHADEILDAALEDVKNHDGAGHHFRNMVLNLNISGVGPKVCSFAWLLLQPLTSQLGTIDTHMMDVLGHNYEKEMNNRDYFKFERELAAGRDAAGYSHIPLGSFQWGMWDHKRTGAGSHQDHSAMRVLDPVPHANIDWVGKAKNLKGESWLQQAPQWWQETQPARDAVAQDFDNTIGTNHAQGVVPYQVTAKVASLKTSGPTKMQRARQDGRSTVDVWAQTPEWVEQSAWSLGREDSAPNDGTESQSQSELVAASNWSLN